MIFPGRWRAEVLLDPSLIPQGIVTIIPLLMAPSSGTALSRGHSAEKNTLWICYALNGCKYFAASFSDSHGRNRKNAILSLLIEL